MYLLGLDIGTTKTCAIVAEIRRLLKEFEKRERSR